MRSSKLQESLGILTLAAALIISGCNDDKNNNKKTAMCSAAVGDLQITEFLVNPNGPDNTKEWFEIKNIGGSDQILNGLVLRQEVINTKDGTISKTKEYTVKTSDFSLAQGSYFVFGDGDSDWVDHNYGSGLADWNNTSSILSIVCDDTVIDSVAYGSDKLLGKVVEGIAFSFDGKTWCSAVNSYDNDGNLGTPGTANPSCDVTYCKYNGNSVAAKLPAKDDLVITEILANPKGTDGKQEYIELYNASNKELDLYNMRVEITIDGSTEPKQVVFLAENETKAKREDCLRFNNQYILLGQSMDSSLNGGITPQALFSDSLPNSGKKFVYSLYSGSTLISETTAFPTPKDGDVWAINPKFLDDSCSTDSWCVLSDESTSLATPGAANNECTVMSDNTDVPPDPPTPTCDGTAPAAGDLVITEIYSDAEGTSANEFAKEFIEVYATKAVTASSLKIISKSASKSRNFTVNFGECYTFTPNSYVVFDGNTDADNPATYTRFNYTGSKDGLFNPKDGYSLEIYYNDIMIDTAPNHIGNDTASSQLDSTKLSALENDNKDNWCTATPTPGAANGICQNSDNTDDDITCDGTEPSTGSMIITEIYSNAPGSASEEFDKEFIEIRTQGNALNAAKLTILSKSKTATRTFTVDFGECITLASYTHYVFGGSTDRSLNGIINVDYAYTGPKDGLYQPNKGYTIEILYKDTVIATAANELGTETESAQLDFNKYNDSNPANIENWCTGTPNPGEESIECNSSSLACNGPAPVAGDLVITEIFFDPVGKANADEEAKLEFLELIAVNDVNLSNLTIKTITDSGATRTFNAQFTQCMTYPEGSIIVLAANSDKNTNGNMDVDLVYVGKDSTSKDGFSNPTGTKIYTATISVDDTVIDSISYQSVTEGKSFAVIPDMATSELNDNINNWCANTPTPGEIDMQCPTI